MSVRISMSQKSAKQVIAALAVALFSIPQIALYLTHASFLALANEAISYRYFLAARLNAGEGGQVWLPQGQLTSLIQRVIYETVNPSLDLWDRMDAFGLLYGVAVVLVFGALLTWLLLDETFTPRDTLLVAATPVTITYVLLRNFNYTLQPDYQHLDMVLFAAAVALFIYFGRNPRLRVSTGELILAGGFAGLCLANKVSLLVLSAAAISPLFVDALRLRDWRGLLAVCVITPIIAAVTALAILLTLYGFSWRAAKLAFGNIVAFALNPGENEPKFLNELITTMWHAHYLQAALVAALAVYIISRARPALALILFVAAAMFIAFIWHRPTGSTAFDAGCAMVAITAMALSLVPEQRFTKAGGLGLGALLLSLGLANFPFDFASWLHSTREKQAARVALLHAAEKAEYPIIAVIPDDRWAAYGPLPAILKGFSVFPTWRIPEDRKLPVSVSLTYRTTYGGPGPDDPYPPHAAILWEDRPGLRPLTEIYPALLNATQRRNCRSIKSEGDLWLCLPK